MIIADIVAIIVVIAVVGHHCFAAEQIDTLYKNVETTTNKIAVCYCFVVVVVVVVVVVWLLIAILIVCDKQSCLTTLLYTHQQQVHILRTSPRIKRINKWPEKIASAPRLRAADIGHRIFICKGHAAVIDKSSTDDNNNDNNISSDL